MHIPDRFTQNIGIDVYDHKNNNEFYTQSKNKIKANCFNEIKEDESQLGSDLAISSPKQITASFIYQQNFKNILEGWINKKTLNSTYQSRYFLLTPTRLMYFNDETKKQLKGCFNFVSLLKYNVSIEYQQFQIKIKLSPDHHEEEFKNRFILQMEFKDEIQLNRWLNGLNKVVQTLKHKQQLSMPRISTFYPQISIESLLQMNQKLGNTYNHNFWNKFNISLYQLQKYSSHLDVLFLRSNNPVAYLSRFFMRSYYDHVAIILKSQLHQTFVFEAIQSRGVCIMDLHTFLTVNKDVYEQIGIRKLIVEQTQQQQKQGLYKGISIQRLQIYLNSLLGKKYQLSLSKLFMDSSDYEPSTPRGSPKSLLNIFTQQNKENYIDNSKQIKKDDPQKKPQKTYFCSELIADIYLKFGILKQGKSKDFWPKDFQGNELKFKSGISFSPMMSVSFSNELI